MLQNILGASWEGKLSAIVVFLAGLSQFTTELGITADSKVGKTVATIGQVAGLIAVVFGFTKSKSSDVTGTGAGAAKGGDVSNVG